MRQAASQGWCCTRCVEKRWRFAASGLVLFDVLHCDAIWLSRAHPRRKLRSKIHLARLRSGWSGLRGGGLGRQCQHTFVRNCRQEKRGRLHNAWPCLGNDYYTIQRKTCQKKKFPTYGYVLFVTYSSRTSLFLHDLMGTVALYYYVTGFARLVWGRLRVHRALFYLDWLVCYVCFVLHSPVSLSSCPFLDILHFLPRTVGVPLESALNLVSRMSPCRAYLMIFTLAMLGVTITCSICYDRADDSSIHSRGTYHILKST